MSLLDSISTDHMEDQWLDTTIEALREKATGSPGANAAIDILEENKDDLAHLGRLRLVRVLAHLASGDLDKATDEYVVESASLEELLAISRESNEIAKQKRAEAIAARSAALRVLLNIGVFTARYLLPLLLTMSIP